MQEEVPSITSYTSSSKKVELLLNKKQRAQLDRCVDRIVNPKPKVKKEAMVVTTSEPVRRTKKTVQ